LHSYCGAREEYDWMDRLAATSVAVNTIKSRRSPYRMLSISAYLRYMNWYAPRFCSDSFKLKEIEDKLLKQITTLSMLNTLHIESSEGRVFNLDRELVKLKSGPFPQLSRLVVDASRNRKTLDWKLGDDGKWLMSTMSCEEALSLWKGVYESEHEFTDLTECFKESTDSFVPYIYID
jgi:hypothetical protein